MSYRSSMVYHIQHNAEKENNAKVRTANK